MSTPTPPEPNAKRDGENALRPLEGEAGIPSVAPDKRVPVSRKTLLAIALLLITLIGFSALALNRLLGGKGDANQKKVGEQPMAAGSEGRRLDLSRPSAPTAGTVVPQLIPTDEEKAPAPIPLRPPRDSSNGVAPEDAPAVLLSSRAGTAAGRREGEETATSSANEPLDETQRNLATYQRRLQGIVENLGKPAAPNAQGGLFGGLLQGSTTPRATAGMLGNRSLTLPKGSTFTCALKTRVVSATSGFIGCQVQRNVFSDDGRVLLIERGSHVDGEYQAASVRPGTVRIPVLWTRVRTPHGVTVDLESPATGALGEPGMDGHVDNRWPERIGAALLLSLIDDSVQLVIQNQTSTGTADAIVLPSTTSSGSKLAEKVLESTINIPPLIYRNQGGIVGVYVARDIDFSSVYALRPVEEEESRQ